jgi:hypothetical protein
MTGRRVLGYEEPRIVDPVRSISWQTAVGAPVSREASRGHVLSVCLRRSGEAYVYTQFRQLLARPGDVQQGHDLLTARRETRSPSGTGRAGETTA